MKKRMFALTIFLALFASFATAATTTRLRAKDHTLAGAMSRMHCNPTWLSEVMRESDIKTPDLQRLSIGKKLTMPAGCNRIAPPQIHQATHTIIAEERVLMAAGKSLEVVSGLAAQGVVPGASQQTERPKEKTVTIKDPALAKANRDLLAEVAQLRKVSFWNRVQWALFGVIPILVAWLLWWKHLDRVAVIAYKNYRYKDEIQGKTLHYELVRRPVYKCPDCNAEVGIDRLGAHASNNHMVTEDPLPESLAKCTGVHA